MSSRPRLNFRAVTLVEAHGHEVHLPPWTNEPGIESGELRKGPVYRILMWQAQRLGALSGFKARCLVHSCSLHAPGLARKKCSFRPNSCISCCSIALVVIPRPGGQRAKDPGVHGCGLARIGCSVSRFGRKLTPFRCATHVSFRTELCPFERW